MHQLRWIVVFALVTGGCAEQRTELQPEDPATEPRLGGVEAQLYPAALVLDHQAALALDDAQVQAIRGELQSAQRELVDLEVALRREREALAGALSGERVDEAGAMEIAARLVEREGAIKLLHLRLLVRIKNQLTPVQRRRLDELRAP